jgi:hypothetical protein
VKLLLEETTNNGEKNEPSTKNLLTIWDRSTLKHKKMNPTHAYRSTKMPQQFACLLFILLLSVFFTAAAASSPTGTIKRQCFTEYSDFAPGFLKGDWSGLTDEEWEAEEKAGRRQRVSTAQAGLVSTFSASPHTLSSLYFHPHFLLFIQYLFIRLHIALSVWEYDMSIRRREQSLWSTSGNVGEDIKECCISFGG